MKLEHELHLPASPGQVAEVLSSAADAPRWQDGLVEMEIVRGGPDEVGSLALLHYRENDRSYVMNDEMLECEPGRRWKSRVSGNGMTILVETVLEEHEGQTLLRMTWNGRPDLLRHRLLFWLARPVVQRHIQSDLDSLARLLVDRGRADPVATNGTGRARPTGGKT